MRDSIDVDGTRRTYEVIGPEDGRPPRSLVVVFHGSKQTGARHRAFTGRAYDALTGGGAAMVVYPDGYRKNWNDARRASRFPARRENIDDVGFTRALVAKLTAGHGIDPHRVFAVGYSNGGQMVIRLIHEAPDLMAGAAVIAATMPAPENFLLNDEPHEPEEPHEPHEPEGAEGAAAPGAPEERAAPMPVLLIHGTKDPIVGYDGEMSWWVRKVFKVGGRSLSAPATAAYFAARNGITAKPVTTGLPPSSRATSVDRTDYRQPGRPPVVLYTVHGGGHTVPGPAKAPAVLGRTNHDIDAAGLVGEFFAL
jgi:polyhydroxybutyrate depolymerase